MEARTSTARPEEFDEFDTLGRDYYDDEIQQSDRTISALAHLSSLVGFGLIVPIVVYFLKRDQSDFAAFHAKEAINFHITVILAVIVSVPLIVVFGLGLITILVAAIGSLIYGVIAAIRALDGEWYEYPFTLRLVK